MSGAAGPAWATVGEEQRTYARANEAVPWSQNMRESLREEGWPQLCGREVSWAPESRDPSVHADYSFVIAWVASLCGDLELLERHYPRAMASPTAPEAYRSVLEARRLIARGEAPEGATGLLALAGHPVLGAQALSEAGEALRGDVDEAAAVDVWLKVQEREGSLAVKVAALEAAGQAGASDPRGGAAYRALWARGVTSRSLDGLYGLDVAVRGLDEETARSVRVERVEALASAGRFHDVRLEVAELGEAFVVAGEEACRWRYAYGKSLYRTGSWTEAIRVLSGVGTDCVGVDEGTGAPAWYLVGTMHGRRGHHASAAKAYGRLVEGYPDHSMADDALTRGGIALQEAGKTADAWSLWARALQDFPEGDTTPDAAWRLAFAHYSAGRPGRALEVAEQLAALGEVSGKAVWAKGTYWRARWLLYPDVTRSDRAAADPDARQEALGLLKQVVEEAPFTVHALLAASRLMELAPSLLQAPALTVRDWKREEQGWLVDPAFLSDPCADAALRMARLGLGEESARALDCVPDHLWGSPERGLVWDAQRLIGDELVTHRALRGWLKNHPPGTLGHAEDNLLGMAYPDMYWDEVRHAVSPYDFPPRLLHALIREESAFDAEVVSHAGAVGLAQLMPATAVQTAGWLDDALDPTDLEDPATNLALGARYLAYVLDEFSDNPALALAGYNAGPHRVRQWVARFGNIPVDEFMERIPFHETRGYVARVLSTYQMLRWRSGTEPVYGDMSPYNHRVLP